MQQERSGPAGMKVVGWGAALPEKVVDNAFFASTLDTSDAWIRERTGIVERRHGGSTAGLAVTAVAAALERAGRAPGDVDALVLATTTPDRQIPATSAAVQHELGLRGGAFDVNAACSGFVYALVVAHGLVRSGMGTVVVAGSETLTRFTDMTDRATAVLMGDGAGALVLTASDEDRLLASDLGCDGSAGQLLYAEIGSTMQMTGRDVFKRAVRASVGSARRSLAAARLTIDDIDLFVPHQANLRIMEAVARRLGLPGGRMAVTVDRTGNTSAASIPIALDGAASAGRLTAGDLVLLCGFGAGMTWASAVLRWG
jgi:3-oxoacyl-[acyl-carrier-protein] synthase-3